jgi:hypothetical protein
MSKSVLDKFPLDKLNDIVSLQTKVSLDNLYAMNGYFDKVLSAEYLIEVIDWVTANK